jgi:hypothetical protein
VSEETCRENLKHHLSASSLHWSNDDNWEAHVDEAVAGAKVQVRKVSPDEEPQQDAPSEPSPFPARKKHRKSPSDRRAAKEERIANLVAQKLCNQATAATSEPERASVGIRYLPARAPLRMALAVDSASESGGERAAERRWAAGDCFYFWVFFFFSGV